MEDFRNIRILFYGTPYFAVPSLELLVKSGCNVVGVVTAPDKKAGRGMKMQSSDVKKAAEKLGIPVFQPTNLKSEKFLEILKSLQVELQIIIAFRMMPEKVWGFPPLGSFNLHGSLLPKYRGAAPIHHAVINGEKETGVTTFFLKHKIDTGNILLQNSIPIEIDDTVGTVHDKMMVVGADLVLKTLKGIANNSLTEKEQNLIGDYPHAPKLSKEFCEMDWSKTKEENYNFIRGLNPFPVARTIFQGKILKIYLSKIASKELKEEYLIEDDKLYFRCANGSLEITELQLEGKKRMKTSEFIRGLQNTKN